MALLPLRQQTLTERALLPLHDELFLTGCRLVSDVDATQADLRRGISTLYYSLFHELTDLGSALITAGSPALRQQVTRAFGHQAMRKVCNAFARRSAQPMPKPLDRLSPSPLDERVILIADAFIELQEARHSADYDTAASFDSIDATDLVQRLVAARLSLSALQDHAELTVFLAALLFHDRWSRSG